MGTLDVLDSSPTFIEVAVAELMDDVLFKVDADEHEIVVDRGFVGRIVHDDNEFAVHLVFPKVLNGQPGMLPVRYTVPQWLAEGERGEQRDAVVAAIAKDVRHALRAQLGKQ